MQVQAQENRLVLLTFSQNWKWHGIDCEYVSEYAKDRVWQGDQFVLQHCQLYVTGKQCLKIARLIGKVDVIVTDSPIAIGAMYTDEQPYKDVCIYEAKNTKEHSTPLLNVIKSIILMEEIRLKKKPWLLTNKSDKC